MATWLASASSRMRWDTRSPFSLASNHRCRTRTKRRPIVSPAPSRSTPIEAGSLEKGDVDEAFFGMAAAADPTPELTGNRRVDRVILTRAAVMAHGTKDQRDGELPRWTSRVGQVRASKSWPE